MHKSFTINSYECQVFFTIIYLNGFILVVVFGLLHVPHRMVSMFPDSTGKGRVNKNVL